MNRAVRSSEMLGGRCLSRRTCASARWAAARSGRAAAAAPALPALRIGQRRGHATGTAPLRQAVITSDTLSKELEFEQDKTTVLFRVLDEPGALNEVLTMFGQHGFDMTHIQSRLSKDDVDAYEFEIDFKGDEMDPEVSKFLDVMRESTEELRVLGKKQVPWFPRHISDFDHFTQKTLDAAEDLESDHPGFNDPAYRQRRADICTAAMAYKAGTGRVPNPIERVHYDEDEVAAWGAVYNRLMKLYPAHACKEAQHNLKLLQRHAGYSPDQIPQLEDVSIFLREASVRA